jgi:hypothetical protein
LGHTSTAVITAVVPTASETNDGLPRFQDVTQSVACCDTYEGGTAATE